MKKIKITLDAKVKRELELEQEYQAVSPDVHYSVIKALLDGLEAGRDYIIVSFNTE